MADKVKAVIEAMMWDLRSLEKKAIFSTEEVKDIVAKREDFEYRMNKNSSTDLDFLTAIQYEMQLVGSL